MQSESLGSSESRSPMSSGLSVIEQGPSTVGKSALSSAQSMVPPASLYPSHLAPVVHGAAVQAMAPPGTLVLEGNLSHSGNYSFNGNVQPQQTDQLHRMSIRTDGNQEVGAVATAPPFLQPASLSVRPSSNTSASQFASNNFSSMTTWMPPAPTFQVPAGMPNTPVTRGPPAPLYPSPSPQAAPPGPWLQPQNISCFGRPPFSPYTAAIPGPYPMPARATPPSVSLPDIQPPGVCPVVSAVGTSTSSVAASGQPPIGSGQAELPPGIENDKHVGNSETKDDAPIKEQLDTWTAHRTETGAIYYYNALTGESTYEKPQGFKGESDKATVQPTPISWEKLTGTDWTLVTTNDGKRYYYNTKTQLSSWQVPSEVTELRKKQEADPSKVPSVSVINSSMVTEKGSDPVTLSTPAATTGGRDAIAVKSSSVSGSSSALDLIKKKLQDSGMPDSASPGPPLSGAVALELNGSKPTEGAIKGPQNENKDKHKDAYGDGDLSNSSSDSEDEDGGPTKEDCIRQFKEMLKERGVAPFSKWEKELPKIVFDPRFKAIPNHSARRALFEHYVRTRAEEERKEKRAAQKAALEGFKQLLDEAKEAIDHNTDYQTFKKRWGEDLRFQSLDRKEREVLLNERVIPLKRTAQERAQAERAAAISNFKSMLRDKAEVTLSSRWSKVKDNFRSDPRYKFVKHEDREKLFNECVAELKAAEEETERKAMAKQDEEEKLKERERALRKRKEREEQEVERVRQKARRKEAVESYQALLVETMKDPQASWTESKPKLEKDPQGRAANPHLDKSDLEKLFREHVKTLHEKCVLEFRALLTEVITAEAAAQETKDGKTIISSWSTAKQLLKSDPRYNKMPRKERESLWRRYAEEIQRKQKKSNDQEVEKQPAEGKGRASDDTGKPLSGSRRAHDRR